MTDRLTRIGNYYVRRPQATQVVDRPPFEETPLGIAVGTVVLLSLLVGLPFLLWLVAQ